MKNFKTKLMTAVTIAALSVSASAFAETARTLEEPPKPPQVTCPNCGHKFDMPRPAHFDKHMKGQMRERMMKMIKEDCALIGELTGKDAEAIGKECRDKKMMTAQYAKEAGVYDAYKAKKMEQVKAHLDKRVKDGKLTQEKADKRLEKFSEMLDKMSNGERPFGGKEHRMHGERHFGGRQHRMNCPEE